MSERKITDADAEAIAEHFHHLHVCRFRDIQTEDLLFMKDLLLLYKETRSEIIKWVVRGFVYGALVLIMIMAWFKAKGFK